MYLLWRIRWYSSEARQSWSFSEDPSGHSVLWNAIAFERPEARRWLRVFCHWMRPLECINRFFPRRTDRWNGETYINILNVEFPFIFIFASPELYIYIYTTYNKQIVLYIVTNMHNFCTCTICRNLPKLWKSGESSKVALLLLRYFPPDMLHGVALGELHQRNGWGSKRCWWNEKSLEVGSESMVNLPQIHPNFQWWPFWQFPGFQFKHRDAQIDSLTYGVFFWIRVTCANSAGRVSQKKAWGNSLLHLVSGFQSKAWFFSVIWPCRTLPVMCVSLKFCFVT